MTKNYNYEQKIFLDHIFEAKYRFLIARKQFIYGEISEEELHTYASILIEKVRKRRNQVLGRTKKYRLKLSASELIANP